MYYHKEITKMFTQFESKGKYIKKYAFKNVFVYVYVFGSSIISGPRK